MASDDNRGPGRPRKRADEARIDGRYAEAHRLEGARDEAQARWEASGTVADKAALCAAEMRAAAAWASAYRSDGKAREADAAGKAAREWAQAHAKALDQLVADRVEELHRRVVRREEARLAAQQRSEE